MTGPTHREIGNRCKTGNFGITRITLTENVHVLYVSYSNVNNLR